MLLNRDRYIKHLEIWKTLHKNRDYINQVYTLKLGFTSFLKNCHYSKTLCYHLIILRITLK